MKIEIALKKPIRLPLIQEMYNEGLKNDYLLNSQRVFYHEAPVKFESRTAYSISEITNYFLR